MPTQLLFESAELIKAMNLAQVLYVVDEVSRVDLQMLSYAFTEDNLYLALREGSELIASSMMKETIFMNLILH